MCVLSGNLSLDAGTEVPNNTSQCVMTILLPLLLTMDLECAKLDLLEMMHQDACSHPLLAVLSTRELW